MGDIDSKNPVFSAIIFPVLFIGIIVSGCAGIDAPVCAAPYIVHGNSCCLDRDVNSICDVDEDGSSLAQEAPGAVNDCSLCIPKFVTEKEQVIVYRYVCMNGSIVDSVASCGEQLSSNADRFVLNQEQDPSFIKTFTVTPVCRGEFKAGEIHIIYEQQPLNITLQLLDDPDGAYKNVATLPTQPDIYYYIGFCKDCQQLINLRLDADRAYAVRMMLDYPDRKVYSGEYLLDPMPRGNIGRKNC
jgi:hypothetical protein